MLCISNKSPNAPLNAMKRAFPGRFVRQSANAEHPTNPGSVVLRLPSFESSTVAQARTQSLLLEQQLPKLRFRICAVPVERPLKSSDFPCRSVDQERRRQTHEPECQLHTQRFSPIEAKVSDADVVEKPPTTCDPSIIYAERQYKKICPCKLRRHGVQRRHLFAAGWAPCRPDIQEYHATGEIDEVPLGSGLVQDWRRKQRLRVIPQSERWSRLGRPGNERRRQASKNGAASDTNGHRFLPVQRSVTRGHVAGHGGFYADTANSVIMPVERWGMWWQCSIHRAASPASTATVTMPIGGTCTVSRTAPAKRAPPVLTT